MPRLLHCAVATIIILAAASSAPARPDSLTLTLEGDCPGRVVLTWEGATPDRPLAIAFAMNTGELTLPWGPCGGTVLGLGSRELRLVQMIRTGPDGFGQIMGRVSSTYCGGYVQLIVQDGLPCTTSNVAQLP